jgi:hypothetical protein
MSDDRSLDITGAGKLAKAIPAKAWVQLVETACHTFRDCVAPLTATTSGLGRLIEAKFDRLIDAEKVLVADTFQSANAKLQQSGKPPSTNAKSTVLLAALENSARQTDPSLRELWSNLLAQELGSGCVHPHLSTILSRISSEDAHLLAEIAQKEKITSATKRALAAFKAIVANTTIAFVVPVGEYSFNHEFLGSLSLIRSESLSWRLTTTGWAFVHAVSGVEPGNDG